MPVPTWSAPTLTPDDLIAAALHCREALAPGLHLDWSVPAGDLEWTCRHTLDHISDALLFYSVHLATAAPERRARVRDGDNTKSIEQLLDVVVGAATILGRVATAMPAGTRAFHPAGMADATGFLAMGCVETMIHTDDIAAGLGMPFNGSDEIAARVIARIFPWAPIGHPAWDTIRWCCGRAPLGDLPRQDEFWFWHCAPLSEWDGTVRRRNAPAPAR